MTQIDVSVNATHQPIQVMKASSRSPKSVLFVNQRSRSLSCWIVHLAVESVSYLFVPIIDCAFKKTDCVYCVSDLRKRSCSQISDKHAINSQQVVTCWERNIAFGKQLSYILD